MSSKVLVPADIDIGTPIVDTSASNAAATIEGDVVVPKNRQLLGFLFKLALNITEAGVVAGTSFAGETVQSFKAKPLGAKNEAIDLNEGSAMQLAAMSEFARQIRSFGTGTPTKNQVMAASATDYWHYAYIVSPFHPDVRQAYWKTQLKAIVLAGTWSAPTAYARELWVAPLFTDKLMPPQRLQALTETNTRVAEGDVFGFGAGLSGTELSTVMTTLQIGNTDLASTNLIKVKENAFNLKVHGMNTAHGTPTKDVPDPGVIVPWHATNRLYALDHEIDEKGPFTAKFTSSALTWFVRKPWESLLD